MEEQTFTIIVNNKSRLSKKFDYEGAMEKYNSLISSKKYTTIKIIDADKNVIEEWEEEDGDIQIPQNKDLKTFQENIQMNDENTPIAKKRGRKPKSVPISSKEEKKVEEEVIMPPLPPYLEKEIAEHKEGCECELCQVAKVALECRQEDIKELKKEIPELAFVPDTPPVSPTIHKTLEDCIPEGQDFQNWVIKTHIKIHPLIKKEPKTKEISTQTDDFECLACASKRKSDDPDYWKKYYEANKEKLKEQKKKWRDANKDKVNSEKKKEYQRKYDAKNKDKIKERRERLVVCECGEEMKAFSLRKHKTSKIHKLKVELKIARGEPIVETPIEEDEDNSSTSSTLSS
jgi:hypothetical protein